MRTSSPEAGRFGRALWTVVVLAIGAVVLPVLPPQLAAAAPVSYADEVLADNPATYLRFDEESGQPIQDSSGRNTPIPSFTAQQALPGALPDSQGYAASDLSTLWENPSAPGLNSRAVEFWLGRNPLDLSNGREWDRVRIGGLLGGWLTVERSTISFSANDGPTIYFALDAEHSLLPWMHIVANLDFSSPAQPSISIYANGKRLGDAQKLSAAQLSTARSVSVWTSRESVLDELAVYDHELQVSRIEAHLGATGYTAPSSPTGVQANGLDNGALVKWDPAPASVELAQRVIGTRVDLKRNGVQWSSRWSESSLNQTTFSGLEPGTYTATITHLNAFGSTETDSAPFVVTGDPGTYGAAVQTSGSSDWFRLGEPEGSRLLANSAGGRSLVCEEDNEYSMSFPSLLGGPSAILSDPDDGSMRGFEISCSPLPVRPETEMVEAWLGTMANVTVGELSVLRYGNLITVLDDEPDVGSQAVMQYFPVEGGSSDWAHVALQTDGSTVKLFVNGALVGTGTSVGSFMGELEMYSMVDEVALYDRALTEGELRSHWQASGRSGESLTAPVILETKRVGSSLSVTWEPHIGAPSAYVISAFDDDTKLAAISVPGSVQASILRDVSAATRVEVEAVLPSGSSPASVAQIAGAFSSDGRYSDAVRSAGPIAWFRFDDSAGSPVAADSSTTQREGRFLDLARTRAEGKSPFTFGGESAMANPADGNSIRLERSVGLMSSVAVPKSGWSTEMWVRAEPGAALGFMASSNSESDDPALEIRDDGVRSGRKQLTERNLWDGEWHHLVISSSGLTSTAYVDGGVIATTTGDGRGFWWWTDRAPLILHTVEATGGPVYVDELAFYPSPLTAEQVANHFLLAGRGVGTTTKIPEGQFVGETGADSLLVKVIPNFPTSRDLTGTVTVKKGSQEVASVPVASNGETRVPLPDLGPGLVKLTAQYSSDSTMFLGSKSEETDVQVQRAKSTLTVKQVGDPVLSGEAWKVRVAVTSAEPRPEGTIKVSSEGQNLRTAQMKSSDDGSIDITMEGTDPGDRLYLIEYAGSTSVAPSSETLSITVLDRVRIDTDRGPPSEISALEQATWTVAVGASHPRNPNSPTGSISAVIDGEVDPASLTPVSGGIAAVPITIPTSGKHTIAFQYEPSPGFIGSTTEGTQVDVNKSRTETALTSDRELASSEEPVEFTAVLKQRNGTQIPAGTVRFEAAGRSQDVELKNGTAKWSVTLPGGKHTVKATYLGNSAFAGSEKSIQQAVDIEVEVKLTSSRTSGKVGDTAKLKAIVRDLAGNPATTGSVEFKDGTTRLGVVGVDGAGTAELDVTLRSVSGMRVTAGFTGAGYRSNISDAVVITVSRHDSPIQANLTSADVVFGQRPVLTVDATRITGVPFPGPVKVSIDGEQVGQWSLPDGTFTRTLSFPGDTPLSVGSHTVKVSHAADDSWAAGSVTIPFEVTRADTNATLSVSEPVTYPGGRVEARFTVKAVAPGAGSPTGAVTLLIDGSPAMVDGSPLTGTVREGVITVPTSALTVGTHHVSVRYEGDNSFNNTESAAVQLVVKNASTVTTSVESASPTALGEVVAVTVSVGGAAGMANGTVVLYDGERPVAMGTLALGSVLLTTNFINAGERELVAKYMGDQNYAPGVSASAAHKVNIGAVSKITLTSSPQPLIAGRSNSIVAYVSGTGDPFVRPQGVVRFEDGNGEIIGSGTLRPDGSAVLAINPRSAGSVRIYAQFEGGKDPNYPLAAGSAIVDFAVEPALELETTIDATRGVSPLNITGNVKSVSNPAATIEWFFGDGTAPTPGNSASHRYSVPGLYKVTVVATTSVQQTYTSHTVRVASDEPPAADPGGDRRGFTGKVMYFDGSNSRPFFGVDSWLWEFGDGATSTSETPSHTYTDPGTYKVKLTITSGDVTTSAEAQATIIRPEDDGEVNITVKSGGTLLSGAEVVVNDQIAGRVSARTNGSGVARLDGLADGVYTVYAVAGGYRPTSMQLAVDNGHGAVTIDLAEGAAGTATLTHRELTPQEVVAAGIDPTLPENRHVVSFEIHLPYVSPQTVYYSSGGGFTSPGCAQTCTFESGPWRVTGTPVKNAAGETTAISWIVIPGQIGFTKQFFEVTLVVTNLSGEEFSFRDGVASLDLPAGLSLAPMKDQQSPIKSLDVPGGGTGSVAWIVRGDKSGSYNLNATYAAALDPLGTPVRIAATTSTPLVVYGPEALTMTVTSDTSTVELAPMRVSVELTNTANVTLDNPVLALGPDLVGALYQPEQQLTWSQASLAPGQSMNAELRLVPLRDGEIDLSRAFVRIVGGERLGADRFVGRDAQPALTLTAPDEQSFAKIRIDWEADGHSYNVYELDPETRRFGDKPVVANVANGTASISAPPGESKLIAISRVGGPRPIMLHNAIGAVAGNTSASWSGHSVRCNGADSTLTLQFEDPDWPVEKWRIIDAGEATVAEGDIDPPKKKGEIEVPIDPTLVDVFIQVSNNHDRYAGERAWSAKEPLSGCSSDNPNEKRGSLDSVGKHGDPVNTLTGASWLSEPDIVSPPGVKGLDWYRNYDSGGTAGLAAWAFPYSERLALHGDGSVGYRSVTTREVTFQPDGSGGYRMVNEELGRLEKTPTGWRIVYPDQTVIAFDHNGRVSARSFGYGQVVTAQRDSVGRLLRLTSNVRIDGSVHLSFEYAGDHLTRVVSSDGRFARYGYNDSGHLISATVPGEVTWRYGYDGAGRLTDIIDPAGVTLMHNTLDGLGRVSVQTNQHGLTVRYDYGVTNRPLVAGAAHATVATDLHDGSETLHQYDDRGRLVAETDPAGRSTTMAYGPLDLITSVTTSGGATETTSYYEAGSAKAGLIERVSGPTTETRFAYDDFNRVATETVRSVTHPAAPAQVTEYGYEGSGRIPVLVKAPGGATARFEVNRDGLITSTTDADGVASTFGYDSLNRLRRTTDGLGHDTVIDYDGAGRITRTVSAEGRATSYRYDDAGRLTSTELPDGNQTAIGYDTVGRTTAVIDQIGKATTFNYDPATGAILSQTDPLGRTTRFDYDRYGALVSVQHPDRSVARTAFNALRQVESTTDEENRTTRYRYDADGRLNEVRDPAGLIARTVYDSEGRVISVTPPDGVSTRYAYDGFGRTREVSTVEGTSSFSYSSAGHVDRVIDPRGVVAQFRYSAAGRPADEIVNDSRRTSYDYDAAGRSVSITAPGGRKSSVILDADGLVKSSRSPAGLVTSYTYDSLGRQTSVKDPAGVVTKMTYDARGMVESVTHQGQGSIKYGYDDAGQLISVTDAKNNVTRYVPDERGRTKRVTDALGGNWDTDYDRTGLVRASSDPLNRRTQIGYDAAGRTESVLDPSGIATSYSYDSAGRLGGSSSTNAAGQTLATALAYDPATSRPLSQTMGGRKWVNTYNSFGDLTSRTNPEGRQLQWSYDQLSRVAGITGVDGRRQDFAYDDADNLIDISTPQAVADKFTAPDGSALDPAKWIVGQKGRATVRVAANSARLSVADTNGSRAEFAYNGSVPATTTISFSADLSDAQNKTRLHAYNRFADDRNFDVIEFHPESGDAVVSRGAAGTTHKLGTLKVPTDRAFNISYLATKDSVSVKVWASGAAEPAGWNLSVKTKLALSKGAPKWVATGGKKAGGSFSIDDVSVDGGLRQPLASYSWDADGRLTREQLSAKSFRDWNWADGRLAGYSQQIGNNRTATQLGYDSSGRVGSETTAGSVTNYGYDTAGQLLSVDAPGKKSDVVYGYDELGRRRSETQNGAVRTNAYDAAGQLVTSTPARGTPTVFRYDGAGRRLSETTGTSGRSFGYDPAGQLVATTENRLTTTRVLDPAGQPERIDGIDGSTLLDWTPGGELVSLTRPGEGLTTPVRPQGDSAWSVAMVGTKTKVLGSDVLGSTLNPNRLATAKKYDAFGVPVSNKTTDAAVSLGYRGELTIAGLTYLRARNYDPVTGQFTTVDPAPGLAGTTSASNPYAYVNNDPLNQTDPSGLFSASEFWTGLTFGVDIAAANPDLLWEGTKWAAGKAWNWAVDHKADIAGFVVGTACLASGMVVGCLALGGAVRGGIQGWESSCGNGASVGECATGVALTGFREGAIDAAFGVVFMGLGKVGKGLLSGARGAFASSLERMAARRAATGIAEEGTVSLVERIGRTRAGAAIKTAGEKLGARRAMMSERGSVELPFLGRGAKPKVAPRAIDPSDIRLSQATINGPKTSEITASMRANGWQGDAIDVVRMSDGRLTAFDNKRVVAANDAGIQVQARVQAFHDAFPAGRLSGKGGSPTTWGDAISQRIAGQKRAWRSCYPMGASFTCRMGDY